MLETTYMNPSTIKINLSKYVLLILCILTPYKIYGENKLLNVSIVPLSSVLISTKNSAPANIISINHSTLSAEITGRVNSINSEAGSFVRKGEKLASLDCRSYLLAKKQAEAALKVAETQFNLAKKQLVRNQQLERVFLNYVISYLLFFLYGSNPKIIYFTNVTKSTFLTKVFVSIALNFIGNICFIG